MTELKLCVHCTGISCDYRQIGINGGAENAGVENAGGITYGKAVRTENS